MSKPLSRLPTLSFPSCVHKSTLYIRVSLPSPQIGSSLLKNFNTATEFPFLSHFFFLK